MTYARQLSAAQRRHEISCDCCDCDDAREEYIEDNAPAIAAALMKSEDFAWTAIGDLSRDVQCGFAEDLGRFFERFHVAPTDADEAQAGFALYRTLKPYVEAAAMEQARTDAAAAYDALQAELPRSHVEARAMSEAA